MGHQCLKCGVLYAEGSTVILRGCPECRGTRFFYTTDALGADERRKMMSGTEVTLREAIEELVQKAKEGAVDPETDHWMLAGPTPKPIIVDPAIVPPDLPSKPKDLETIGRITDALQTPSNIVVKVPKAGRKRAKREGPRWDYVAPPEAAPDAADAPPLFSYQGVKPVASTATLPPAPVVAAPTPAPPPSVPAVEAPAHPEPPTGPATVQSTLPLAEPTPEVARQVAAAIHDEPAPLEGERPETIHIAAPGRYEIDVKRLLEASPVVIQKDGTYLIHLASLFESVPKPKK